MAIEASGRTQHSPLNPRWRHLRRRRSEVQLPCGPLTAAGYVSGVLQGAPLFVLSCGGKRMGASFAPYLWVLPWEDLGSIWDDQRNRVSGGQWELTRLWVPQGSDVPSEPWPRQPSVCETRRQECDRLAWW